MKTIIDNKEFEFTKDTGIVNGYNKNIINTSYVSGGNGMIVNGTGYVAPSQIHTYNIPKVEFFLTDENENDKDISITGHDIRLRDGQNISLIWGQLKNAKFRYLIAIYNWNTDSYQFITNPETINLLGFTSKKVNLPVILYILIFFLPLGLFLLIYILLKNRSINKKNDKLILEVNDLVRMNNIK